MHTRVRLSLAALFASLAIASIGVGPGLAMSMHPSHHHHHHHQGRRAPGIPQHNGGDHDMDNNGAPSDGDGNQ